MMKKYFIFYFLVMLIVQHRSMIGQEKLINTDIIELGIRTDKSNYAFFNSPIFTFQGNIYVCFVQPDELNPGKYKTVIGKYSGGKWQFCDIEPDTRYDPWHTQPSLALDTLGYIHVTYNMHSSPWQYSKSISPENISSWEFLGQKLEGPHDRQESSYVSGNGTANIPGNRITYQYMTIDRDGTLYISYRECKYCSQGTDYYRMQWSLGISKYDVLSKTWKRLGPEGGFRPFATEPGRRAQVGRVFFDLNNRMHITWNWYHEYERDGSGHKKSNFPVYVYSDDGGITFHRADDGLVQLPITMSQTDTVISPNWSEPNDDGYFYGYTNVSATPEGKPYVWSSPKDPPRGKMNAFSFYDKRIGWSEPLLAPWNAQKFVIDDNGVITFISSSMRVHRSYDGGYTWKNWELDLENGSSLIWIDYSYIQKSNQVRFLAQNKINGELKVYTQTFSAN